MPGVSSTTKPVGFRVDIELFENLAKLAEQKGTNRNKLMHDWIDAAYAAEVRRQQKESPAA